MCANWLWFSGQDVIFPLLGQGSAGWSRVAEREKHYWLKTLSQDELVELSIVTCR